ncbi:efflux RND transporter periplasmic adaptor subunit [Helicobacter jaachi]|uniref:Efflux RND transporter periplasmic adaptor subunit n=1 Tax=Helicobacter jaachi TaxID=1677920 RepID=A0A4U8T6E8_9HELI|nr:efflux RND transporter periplasmic adaptor subunit [Helicobacter jaachi]TLD95141.1 efflux RND transporter periplasmic adaptor subunit [Helicobacter jaachi]
MKFSTLIPAYLCVSLCVLLSLSGCKDSQAQKKERPPLSVNTQTITAQNIALSFEYPGRLKSVQSASVYARVQGILLEKNFKEGDIVTEGAKLFKIDPARYQAKVNQARAQYQAAEANFIKANRDWQRVEKMYKQGVYTIEQYDQSRYNFLSAQANVASTKAALDDAEIDLGYTDVIATISGRTSTRSYDVGNLVGSSGRDILTTITQLSPIYAEFSIPSRDYYFMRGLENNRIQVEFVLGNGMVYEQKGKLDFVDSVLDSETLSVKARAIMDNQAHKLLPNEFVRVRLSGFEAQNAISIPQNALLQDAKGSYVFVIKDGKAHIARVEIGQEVGKSNILVLNGLQNGDVVVLNQLTKIRENAPLQIAPQTPQNPQAGNTESKNGKTN